MERCKRDGPRRHLHPGYGAAGPPLLDPWYDKFWAAAQEMELPLNMHIFTGATPNHGLTAAGWQQG